MSQLTAVVDGDSGICTDPLALNAGSAAASGGSRCAYGCDALKQEYFPSDASSPLTRCFLYDSSSETWPTELLDLR